VRIAVTSKQAKDAIYAVEILRAVFVLELQTGTKELQWLINEAYLAIYYRTYEPGNIFV
jgi:hypothetical protein